MSDQKQVQVTLEELVLKQSDVEQFYALADEIPHKYAKPLLSIIEGKIKEQLEAKVAKLKAEYETEQAKLKAGQEVTELAVV